MKLEINNKSINNLFSETHCDPPFSPKLWLGTFSMYAKNKIIAVISPPKSGSTYVTNVIHKHANIPFKRLCYAYSSNEHDLYLPALMTAKITNGVSQLHMKATPHNIQLMKSFEIKGIILIRNIFDALVSFNRDIKIKLNAGHLDSGIHGYSFVWLNQNLKKLSEEELTNYCIDFYVPWYLNFITSWSNYKKDYQYLFIRYEKLFKNKIDTFTEIMKHINENTSISSEILTKDYLKDKKTISSTSSSTSSGYKTLSKLQIDKIKEKFNYFETKKIEEYLEYKE